MKLLRTSAILSLLVLVIIFNWNCKDEGFVTTAPENPHVDGPGDCTPLIWLNTLEYVQIDYPGGEVSYENRLVDVENCGQDCHPYMAETHYFSITTPPSPRWEGENLITTLSYGFVYGINYCSYFDVRRAQWSGPDWPNCFTDDVNIPANQDGHFSNYIGEWTCMDPDTRYDDLFFKISIPPDDKPGKKNSE